MNEPVKKAAPKKRAAPKQSIIRYADKRLQQNNDKVMARYNNPDIKRCLPGTFTEIETGLEIAIPPGHFVLAVPCVDGMMATKLVYTGYQKELTLKFWNTTSRIIDIEPYSEVAELYLTEMKSW